MFSKPFLVCCITVLKTYMIMISFLQSEYISVDDAILPGTNCNSLGTTLVEWTDPVVVVEKTMLHMPSMDTTVVCCIFCYSIYNIQYPPTLRQFMFFESIFNMKLSSTLPTCVSIFLDSLFKAQCLVDIFFWYILLYMDSFFFFFFFSYREMSCHQSCKVTVFCF